MRRYECLQALLPLVKEDDLVVTNVGGVRVEWHALRPSDANYNVYTLGLCSSVGLGLALSLPHRRVIALDGDGSLLMNLPALTTIANKNPRNLVHIVFDNQRYESSGGGPTHTANNRIDLAKIAEGAGYKNSASVSSIQEFRAAAARAFEGKELALIVASVESVIEPVPPCPYDATEVKYKFMRNLEKLEGKTLLTLAPPAHMDNR
ncbi:MAG: thiamine pyrophosphate-binding protein [Chloroflexi bacterium]|nr:thiamine pyrophosphate-binding protein [Chloroflexota bacterium]